MQQALFVIAFIRTKACLPIDQSYNNKLSADIDNLNLNQPPKVICSRVSLKLIPETPPVLANPMYVDSVANAVSGHEYSLPLVNNGTSLASLRMNEQSNLLQVQRSVYDDSYKLVLRVFQDNLPRPFQCAPGTPSVLELFNALPDLSDSCDFLLSQTLLQETLGQEDMNNFYIETFMTLKRKFLLEIKYFSDDTEKQPITNDLMNEPLFSFGAPTARDIAEEHGSTLDTSMDGELPRECEDLQDTNANSLVVQDIISMSTPGKKDIVVEQLPRVDLPEFGTQNLHWDPRQGATLLTEPPQLEDQ